MTKRTRDSLFYVFIGFFLILTILISLYASGYKINLRWPLKINRLLQKTGMLIVDTNPSGALIYLNDKPTQIFSVNFWNQNYLITPNKIRNLLPGDYKLRLEQKGYWPFEKNINIQSGQSTFVEDINLFRNNLPLLILPTNTKKISLSPNSKYLYLIGEQAVINLKNNLIEPLLMASSTPDWQWTDNGNKLLVDGILFDLVKKISHDYHSFIGSAANLWQKTDFDGCLYYCNNDSLSRLEADGQTNTLLLSGEKYLTYQIYGNWLFFVTEQANQKLIQSYSLTNKKIGLKLALPNSGEYHFMNDNSQFISLYDKKNQTLYLIDPNSPSQAKKIIPNIITWQWINNRQLIYHNRWEIYWLDIDQAQASLVNRLSEEITKILWYNENDYLIFSTPTSLGTIDLKNGYLTTILKAEEINPPELDQKNDTLYFAGQIGEKIGVYKMLLQ